MAHAATFNFSFSNEDGPVNGTVQGTIELPDGDGTFAATSVIVTSAPAALGYTVPLDILGSPVNVFDNSFTVVNGVIDEVASILDIEFDSNVVFALNSPFFGGASYLTDINNPANGVVDTGVFDSDSSTLTYSAAVAETTPEPTSIITLLGVGVLGVASKLKKKA